MFQNVLNYLSRKATIKVNRWIKKVFEELSETITIIYINYNL